MNLINRLKSTVFLWKKKYYNTVLKNKIIAYYQSIKNTSNNNELLTALSYYEKNEITVFPYPFKNNTSLNLNLFHQKDGFYFYELNNEKLYFKKNWSINSCKVYMNRLLTEQHPNSPHRYCTTIFDVKENEILLDIGAAEGNFSLLSVNKALKIKLFEYNNDWIDPLKRSFDKYKNKVEIIDKFVSAKTTQNHIALDDIPELFQNHLFVKMDVEGSEQAVFEGMKKLIATNYNIRFAVCTYHKQNDATDFEKFFKKHGFKTEFSEGYMLYYFANNLTPPYLRKGVIRAWRE